MITKRATTGIRSRRLAIPGTPFEARRCFPREPGRPCSNIIRFASILPITAGGAIAGVGATSGILIAIGVPTGAAVNFSLASGLLLTSSALVAAVVGVSGSVLFAVNRRRLVRAAAR